MITVQEFVEGFFYTSIIQARIYTESGRIIVNPFIKNVTELYAEHVNSFSFRPIPGLTIAIFSMICNVDVSKMLYCPLLGVLNIILISLWVKLLIKDQLIAGLLTLTIAFSYSFLRTSVFFYYIPYGISMSLLFTYVLHKSYLLNSLSCFRNIIILLMFFFTSLFSYYSSSVIIISLIITLVILSRLFANTYSSHVLHFFAPTFAIAYLNFEYVTYSFIREASIEKALEQIFEYFNFLIKVMSSERYYVLERPQFTNLLTFYSDLIHRLSSVSIVLTYLLLHSYQTVKRQDMKCMKVNNASRINSLILFSLLLVGFLETLLYSLVGLFPFLRMLYFAFVMLAFYLAFKIRIFNSKFISYLTLVLAVITCTSNIVHFSSYITNPTHPFMRPYQKVELAVDWLTDHVEKGVIFTFHEPAASLFEKIVAKKKSDEIKVMVIYPETSVSLGAYVLLGKYEVVGMGWGQPVPLSEIKFIAHLDKINKIYAGGSGEVYENCQVMTHP